MVEKIARAMAPGEVPDLMGMDLIYGPQFEKPAARRHHRPVRDGPDLADGSPA